MFIVRVGVLAHNQPLSARASTHIASRVAEDLVKRLVAERISRKLIRMFAPGSVFVTTQREAPIANYIPEKLPPREVSGCRFRGPIPRKPHSIFVRPAPVISASKLKELQAREALKELQARDAR